MSFLISANDFKSLPTQSLQMLKNTEVASGNNFLNGAMSNVFSQESTLSTISSAIKISNGLDSVKSITGQLSGLASGGLSALNASSLKDAISTLGGTQVTDLLNQGEKELISTVSNVTGSVGSVLGTAAGTAQLLSARATMVKDVAMMAVSKIAAYCIDKTTDAITGITGKIITMPMDIASKSASIFSEKFKEESKKRVKALFENQEDINKKIEEETKKNSIDDAIAKAKQGIADANNFITTYTQWINDKITYYTDKYCELGPDALSKYIDNNAHYVTDNVGDFINKKMKFIDDQRAKAVDSIATPVGETLANTAVDVLVWATKDKADKAKCTIAKGKSMVASAKRKVIMKAMSILGK